MDELIERLKYCGYASDDGKVNYHLLSKDTLIPERTLRSWISGTRKPPAYVIRLLLYFIS